MKLSVCIITLNEEANLPRCLESCAAVADEIQVLDSGSTDGTEAVARRFDARWTHQNWLGYVGQKNRVLELATHPWVLSLDADEELSPELRQHVQGWKKAEAAPTVSGYSMPRCTFYEGRWIRHGDWYPDRLVRLFRRDQARFAGGKVHERLELEGTVEPWREELLHYSYRDQADHRARCEKYARLWAETRHEAGRAAGPLAPWTHAAFRWLRGYVWRRGFLDGRPGALIARHSAREVFLKYRMLREMKGGDE